MLNEIGQIKAGKKLHDLTDLWNLKEVQCIEAERRVVTMGGEGGGDGEMVVKGTKLQLHRMSKSRDIMYGVMTVVNHTVLKMETCFQVLLPLTKKGNYVN